ncbi:6601_t:CDS:2, partial [Gigaspora rosea]
MTYRNTTTIKNCCRYTNLIPYWDNPTDSEESEDKVSLEDLLLEELLKILKTLIFQPYVSRRLVEIFEEKSSEIENNPEEVDDSIEEEII